MDTSTNTPAAGPEKVAVVVIHGMGEQRPMDTLREVVETIWERDETLFAGLRRRPGFNDAETWSKPDRVSGSSELRRIKTARARTPGAINTRGIRADFFELHWADITADSTLKDFLIWFFRLLFRNPFRYEVPKRVLAVWLLLWLIVVAFVVSCVLFGLSKVLAVKDDHLRALLTWGGWGAIAAVLLVVGVGLKAGLTSHFGDVARYVSATPRNIRVRQATRERGLNLLRQLHATGEYGRIVVVGHSLGSILAHDLIALLWAESAGKLQLPARSPVLSVVAECEKAGLDLLECVQGEAVPLASGRHERGYGCVAKQAGAAPGLAEALKIYRQKQRALFYALRSQTLVRAGEERPAWVISDLVTVGCPLTHASFLVAKNGCELKAMVRSREILRAPPVYEAMEGPRPPVFSFPRPEPGIMQMHHAAAFAPVRWTNLHDATGAWLFLRGDMISGPLASDFGPGVLDLRVQPRRYGWLGLAFPRLFTHTCYWTYPAGAVGEPPHHIATLRDAVNVLDDPDVEVRLMNGLADELAQKRGKRGMSSVSASPPA